jgi:REP element-mobilizing transposase RayT
MTLYKNKYRVESSRLRGWDYSSPGYYFITICTKNRACLFGKIKNGEMNWSEMGKIADQYWREIPVHCNSIQLDQFTVMPNHIHGLLRITNKNHTRDRNCNRDGNHSNHVETSKLGVSTTWESGKIGVIINQYKRICTIRIRKNNPKIPVWQPRFHDHIIRDENELHRIRKYIVDNPSNWGNDAESRPRNYHC